MRLLSILVVWALAGSAALAVAHETRIGPVVIVLSPVHGIHLGDLIAFGAAVVVASILTLVVLRATRGRSR